MALSKAKTAIGFSIGILVAAGAVTTTVSEVKADEINSWQVPEVDLIAFYQMAPAVKIVPTKFAQDGNWCADDARGAIGIAQSLDTIILTAYKERASRTVMNTELPQGKYDYIAKLVPPREEDKPMPIDRGWAVALQNEIERQFGIKGTYQTRNTEVLLLKPVSTGVRGFTASHSAPPGKPDRKNGNHPFLQEPVGALDLMLEKKFKVPIVDRTGLNGLYDYAIKWDQPDPKQPNLEGLKQALGDQLGLQLVRTNMPMRMLVIEKAK